MIGKNLEFSPHAMAKVTFLLLMLNNKWNNLLLRFKTKSIGPRLLTASLVLFLSYATSLVVWWYSFDTISDEKSVIVEQTLPDLIVAGEISELDSEIFMLSDKMLNSPNILTLKQHEETIKKLLASLLKLLTELQRGQKKMFLISHI